ncbi:MAG: IS1380 family transposase [bacterium]|nr:IS1380 family transposase [bacterium]MCP4110813.1 IS1380 family transposase [Desulfobacteraceae bacterium]
MQTECSARQFEFHGLGKRDVVADFSAEQTTSDGGLLLLREAAKRSGLIRAFAGCFTDHRDPARIDHSVEELVGQRVFGLACGYEDLNDHDQLRNDPMFALATGKAAASAGALAARSTLNRLELSPADATKDSRYKKIVYDDEAISQVFVESFLNAHETPPDRIILDLDATDDPLHGDQEGRFFHGYYRSYCYLPLYIFCGEFLLCARLRRSNIDGCAGSVEELRPIVAQIRARWPEVEIWIRADSGFARDEIMSFCEENTLEYVLGLARNARLQSIIEDEQEEARRQCEATGESARVFKDFRYRTRKSWSRERRVVGKAEQLRGKANPRFVVTSLSAQVASAGILYKDIYCARGDMENRIKEQQLGMFADRTSAHTMRANQLRLWLSSLAYALVHELRRVGLEGTEMARAQVGTIRVRLLKIGGHIKISVRRIVVALSRAFPLQHVFEQALANLRRRSPPPG